MSGIVGVLRVDEGVFDEASIVRMLGRMAHRGPDGTGRWVSGRVGLGHQSLRSTPESRNEVLPFRDASRRLVLTADAKIDNRDELIAELGFAPPPTSPATSRSTDDGQAATSDSHLICAAYRRWGRQCLDHLIGSFAFAIWDEREQVLFCARDHFGVRPFYYHWLPGRLFAFASEIRPLLELPDTPRRLNESRVADFLLDFENDRVATYYQDILRLPPSHWIEIRDDRLTIACYWSPDSSRELHLASDREYADAFRELFEAAVRKDMRSSRPWAVALSGGIDSSSVACVSRKMLADKDGASLNCVCIEFDTAPGGDEREYFNAVVEQGGIVPHYFKADRVKPLDNFLPLLECYDGPIENPHFTQGWSAWQDFRRNGFQVLLDGIDGDVTVSYGFVYLQELARSGAWLTLFREALGLSRNFFDANTSPFSVMWQLGLRPSLPPLLLNTPRVATIPWWEKPRWSRGNAPIIRPEFARRMDLAGRVDQLERHERSLRTSRSYHCEEVTHGVVVASLENANKMCSAFGIEPRHPFFDKRLIEFCIALPREQRIRDGWTRMIVRRALADLLPAKVLHRGGKWGPSRYFAPRLLRLDRDRLGEALTTYLPAVEPYLDTGKLRTIFERSAAEPTVRDAVRLWHAINLGAWLQVSGVRV
jgi:asparagine synthase (glutamine-hydrolysing)